MDRKEIAQQQIIEQRILPLYYHESSEVSLTILKALYQAGVRAVEYTNRGANALQNFMLLLQKAKNEMPGMQLGIGTIKTIAAAEAFIAAGADFIICPIIDPAIGAVVHKANLLWIPGCMTSTEINTAEISGARLIKIFSGSVVGPSYITAIKEIFPNLLFMPTGGVDTTEENLKAWFNSGVSAVGMGSKLITKKMMEENNFDELLTQTATVLQLVKKIKNR